MKRNNKQKKLKLEIRSQSEQRIENKDLSFTKPTKIPRSRRSNNFITDNNKFLIESTSLKREEHNTNTNSSQRFQLQTEGNIFRSRTTNAKTKLPPLNSPINSTKDLELYDPNTEVNYPPTCVKKVRDFTFHSINEPCTTISNNDFRKSSNVFKKPAFDDKILSPSLISKRKSSEINPKANNIFFNSPTYAHSNKNPNKRIMNKPRITKSSKISINAKSISSQESDKSDNDDEDYLKMNNQYKGKSFVLSQAGKDQKGETKTNQDSYVLEENLLNIEGYNIYGVMDGHGTNGHHVSQYLASEAKNYFTNEEAYHSQKNKTIALEQQMIEEKLQSHHHDFIEGFYKRMAKDLPNAKFDVHFSGSTCVMVLKIGQKLICANTGDSRAILIRQDSTVIHTNTNDPCKDYEAIHLSNDHKPETESERKRIEASGGRVDQYEDDGIKNGPFRVWVKGELYPGIAISRTLGDEIAESVGVIYNPDIISHSITVYDRYMVIASDGVWEFLDNSKVMSIVNPFYIKNDPEGACKALVVESTNQWLKEDIVIDDITVIVCFISSPKVLKKNSA